MLCGDYNTSHAYSVGEILPMSSVLTTLQQVRSGNVVPKSPEEAQRLSNVNLSFELGAPIPKSTAATEIFYFQDDSIVDTFTEFNAADDKFGNSSVLRIKNRSSQCTTDQTRMESWLAWIHIQNGLPAANTMALGTQWPTFNSPIIQREQRAAADLGHHLTAISTSVVARIAPSAYAHWRSALLGDSWPSNASRWAELEAEVTSWADLPDDQAEEDGCKPSAATTDAGLSFLARLRSARVPAPNAAFVDADGELGFRWRSKQSSASACFLPDGHIVAYASRSDGRHLWKLDQRYEADLDLNSLFERIRSLF
jgi:hypothetical protein